MTSPRGAPPQDAAVRSRQETLAFPAALKPAGARDGPAGVKLEPDVGHEDVAVLCEPGDHGAAAGVVEANLATAEQRGA